MGFGMRIILIDEDDKIVRIPVTRLERLMERHPKESLLEYKNSRIRFAEIALVLENRKPTSIAHTCYGYLKVDSEGKIDKEFLDKERRVGSEMIDSISIPGSPKNVIYAGHKFARKTFKNEFRWTPSFELQQEIFKKLIQ